VAGGTLFIASPRTGSLTAYDALTGAEKWRFYSDGPARFAPAVAGGPSTSSGPRAESRGRVYFVSDDGHLYCLNAADGTLLWKFRGSPAQKFLLGNRRFISAWPARGAPVVADGKVYFAAGVWPLMGVFVYALDADTGAVVWANDRLGSLFMPQPHNTPAFSGLAPQGYLTVAGDKLLVPGGRSAPACLDRATGRLLYFDLKDYAGGGFDVTAGDDFFCNNSLVYEIATGAGGYIRNCTTRATGPRASWKGTPSTRTRTMTPRDTPSRWPTSTTPSSARSDGPWSSRSRG